MCAHTREHTNQNCGNGRGTDPCTLAFCSTPSIPLLLETVQLPLPCAQHVLQVSDARCTHAHLFLQRPHLEHSMVCVLCVAHALLCAQNPHSVCSSFTYTQTVPKDKGGRLARKRQPQCAQEARCTGDGMHSSACTGAG